MKYDDEVKTWVSISKTDFAPEAGKYVKLKSNDKTGDPDTSFVVGNDKWGGKPLILFISLLQSSHLFLRNGFARHD